MLTLTSKRKNYQKLLLLFSAEVLASRLKLLNLTPAAARHVLTVSITHSALLMRLL